MNTKDTSKKWNVSEKTVRAYLQEKLNPYAYLDGRKWVVPENAPKPPARRAKLVKILQDIIDEKDGVNINKEIAYGMSCAEIEYTYTYLLDYGFIIKNKGEFLVSRRGEELIVDEYTSKKASKKSKTSLLVSGKIGTDGVGINGSYSLDIENTTK